MPPQIAYGSGHKCILGLLVYDPPENFFITLFTDGGDQFVFKAVTIDTLGVQIRDGENSISKDKSYFVLDFESNDLLLVLPMNSENPDKLL